MQVPLVSVRPAAIIHPESLMPFFDLAAAINTGSPPSILIASIEIGNLLFLTDKVQHKQSLDMVKDSDPDDPDSTNHKIHFSCCRSIF